MPEETERSTLRGVSARSGSLDERTLCTFLGTSLYSPYNILIPRACYGYRTRFALIR